MKINHFGTKIHVTVKAKSGEVHANGSAIGKVTKIFTPYNGKLVVEWMGECYKTGTRCQCSMRQLAVEYVYEKHVE